jgi:type VII secretion-associated serine protease mycosin
MSRIAVAVLGAALLLAAEAPAVAATASARVSRAPAAAKASPKPSVKPSSKPPPKKRPSGPSLPVPVPATSRPTQNCPGLQVSSRVTSVPWAQQALDYSAAWPLSEGQRVTVAVVDSGLDYSRQLAGREFAVDLTKTGDQDCVGHGTEVAAIIGASDLQARGVAFEGVAPGARILSVKVNSGENGSSTLLAAGIKDAALLGAKVINVSVQTGDSTVLREAVAVALSKGAVIVAAGGNDGNTVPGIPANGPFYPASYPGVLSVGAVAEDGSLAPYSDQKSRVAVTAPGESLTSVCPGGYQVGNLNGTSYATAFVSGIVALVRARFPHLTGPQVVARIKATANGADGPGTGEGLINPVLALTSLTVSATPGQRRTARPRAVAVAKAPPPDLAVRRIALEVAAGAVGAAALVAIGAVVIGQGRRRRWRAGRAQIPADGPLGEVWPGDERSPGTRPAG